MTKRKLSAENEAKIQALRTRLVLTIRFIEDVQEFPSGAQMRAIAEDAAARGDLRALRLIARDIDNMMTALTPGERDALDAILRDHVGVNRDAERAEMKRQVAAVIARGVVASEKERRRLEDYAEMLEASGGDSDEIEAVRRLVDNS